MASQQNRDFSQTCTRAKILKIQFHYLLTKKQTEVLTAGRTPTQQLPTTEPLEVSSISESTRAFP